MIGIRRLEPPDVLSQNQAAWTADYLKERTQNQRARPLSKRYAHKSVVSTLETMGRHKCFYCEQSTKENRAEVDHYIEVAEKPELAYDWSNLYLACFECNRQTQSNKSISVTECLDPCDPTVQPSAHLIFDNETIRARDNSSLGLNTIQKYKLDREALDYKRMGQLRRIDKTLLQMRERQIADGRKTMTGDEREILRRFQQPDHPFSLMFSGLLKQLNLEE